MRRVKVIYCPDDLYPRGNRLPEYDFRRHRFSANVGMLDEGLWPPGMVIEFDDGRRFVVRGNEGIRPDDPEDAYEPQWLEPCEELVRG